MDRRKKNQKWWNSLSPEQQQAYTQKKVQERNERNKLTRVLNPEFIPKTKFPFLTRINDRDAVVWPDSIEYLNGHKKGEPAEADSPPCTVR